MPNIKIRKVPSCDVKLATADLTNFFVVTPLLHTYVLPKLQIKYKIQKIDKNLELISLTKKLEKVTSCDVK